MKNGPGQKPIKIDANLWQALDDWLKTDDAEAMGYHSKAQFATEAIREYLSIQSGKQQRLDSILAELIKKADFKEEDIEKFFASWKTASEENLTKQTGKELKKKIRKQQ